MLKRVTIKDVAARAGVGTMTVSRVLNSSGYVADAMRAKVQQAINDLGYVPNQMARGLRSRRSGTIALLVTDITNPFFTTMARGAEDAASDGGSLLLLCNTDESEEEELRYVRMLIEKQVDGILLVPARRGTAAIQLAAENGVRVVVLDRTPEADVDVVRSDTSLGAYDLARLLLEKGHRSFGVIAGPVGVPTSDDRVDGFLRALDEAGVRGEATVLHGELNLESGVRLGAQLASQNPRPTAFFTVSNFICYGALRELARMGVRVPEDVAVVGFDDLPADLLQMPFLTMVAQPAYDMGRIGVELLRERLAHPERRTAKQVLLPCELIVRKSSG